MSLTEESQPQPVVPRKSYTQTIIGLILGILIGIPVALVGVFVLLGSKTGQDFLLNYYYTSNVSQVGQDLINSPPVEVVLPANVPVPKSFAGETYYLAINETLNSFNAAATTTIAIGDALENINARAASGVYTGILDMVYEAKNLLVQARQRIVQFDAALSNFEAAGRDVTDSKTKLLSQELVDAGRTIKVSFETEFELIEATLTGVPPTDAQVSALVAQTDVLQAQSRAFGKKLQELVDYFEVYR